MTLQEAYDSMRESSTKFYIRRTIWEEYVRLDPSSQLGSADRIRSGHTEWDYHPTIADLCAKDWEAV